MKSAKSAIVASSALGAFVLSAYFVGMAYPSAVDGYLHDSAYVLFVGSLPIGGWLGADMGWLFLRILKKDKATKTGFAIPAGCLGALIAWPFIIMLMLLSGIKPD